MQSPIIISDDFDSIQPEDTKQESAVVTLGPSISSIPNLQRQGGENNLARALMRGIQAIHDCPCYEVGGSLLPHSSLKARDYDVVIFGSGWDEDKILSFWERHKEMGWHSAEIYLEYDLECADHDESAVAIVCLKHESGICIDLLYANEDYKPNRYETERVMVMAYMKDFFPLSCQCIAKDLETGDIIGHRDVDLIVVRRRGTAYEKYKKYYPNAFFDVQEPAEGEPS